MRQQLYQWGKLIALISLCTACISAPSEPPVQPSPQATSESHSPTPSDFPIAISGSPHSTQTNESPISTPSPSVLPSSSDQNSGFSSSESSISGAFSPVDRALQDLGASIVGNEIRIDLPADILFDFDQYNIRPDANTALQKLLTIINAQAQSSKIRIEGHTDAIADDNYNQTLSERRANAVKSWLSDRGIAVARLTTQGFGETRPVAPNTNPDGSDNPTGRQKNRRVQVRIQRS